MASTTYGHSLPSSQRANLIRSTRKLGAILGETPLVVDDLDSVRGHHGHSSSVSSTDSRRSGRYFADAPPRGPSLTAAGAGVVSPLPTDAAERPLLLLRLPVPERRRPRPLTLTSPMSPSFGPLTPLSPNHTLVVDRRKKMAKLMRTFGSNVPPEMVFAAPPRNAALPSPQVATAILSALAPSHDRSPNLRLKQQRRESGDSLASATREAVASSYASYGMPSPSPAPLSASSTRSSGWSSDEWVGVSTSSASSSPLPSPAPAPHYKKAASPGWNVSADDIHLYRESGTTSRATNDVRFLSKHIEFRGPSFDDSESGSSEFAYTGGGHPAKKSTYRREQGWSGEWSGAGAGGMEDVVSQLRGLRMK